MTQISFESSPCHWTCSASDPEVTIGPKIRNPSPPTVQGRWNRFRVRLSNAHRDANDNEGDGRSLRPRAAIILAAIYGHL
eukprot:5609594-Amphidinium_carterae.1